jgi:hypothetical protein
MNICWLPYGVPFKSPLLLISEIKPYGGEKEVRIVRFPEHKRELAIALGRELNWLGF